MANGTEGSFENPLMPHAKLRQIYVGMLQVHLLDRLLHGMRRGPARSGVLGMEPALVSTSVDLGANDFVSDAVSSGVVDFLRGAPLKSLLQQNVKGKKGTFLARCGSAQPLAKPSGVTERLWIALGAAAAIEASHSRRKREADADDCQRGVAVVYVRRDELSTSAWRPILSFASEAELPILFVVLPAAIRAKGGRLISPFAVKNGVPGIAVDGNDAVAIYRVAQESIGRARAGGGAALIECVDFAIDRTTQTKTATEDAIAKLAEYMLSRRVVTQAWMNRERKTFEKSVSS
jgi:TPP-dependent pyruvate/acetoin dehydrogenase alpha subunit